MLRILDFGDVTSANSRLKPIEMAQVHEVRVIGKSSKDSHVKGGCRNVGYIQLDQLDGYGLNFFFPYH